MSTPTMHTGQETLLESPQHPESRNSKPPPAGTRLDEEHIHGIVNESTVWDLYNNEARQVDHELVKDWTASLNFLLVLAGIFAAVLTAFIIESKKMLEPDQTEILVDITIQYFNTMDNNSRANFTRPGFEPTSAAISINCLLFASLGASLVAALAGVVALQWVADYDAAVTRGGPSPEDRAKCRQFRFAGVTRWKMAEIIAALPLLLYSSVVPFWAGAMQWMWTLHHIVGYVVTCCTALAILFYCSTTFLGAIYVSAPFHTPLSRGVYWLSRWTLLMFVRCLLCPPITSLLRWLLRHTPAPIRPLANFINVTPEQRDWSASHHVVNQPLSEAIPKWISTHLTNDTSRHREDETAKQNPVFEQEALVWLAKQLPISNDSHNRLRLFVRGMLGLPRETSLSPLFLKTPWLAILDSLSTQYMRDIINQATTGQNREGLDILLQLIDHPSVRTHIVPGPAYEQNPLNEKYWLQCAEGEEATLVPRRKDLASMTFLLARDVPTPSLGSKYELEATFKLIRWRNSSDVLNHNNLNAVWWTIFHDINHYSLRFFESCLRLFHKCLTIKGMRPWTPGAHCPTACAIPSMIVEQALSRALTIGEAITLAQVFADSITHDTIFPHTVNEDNPIPEPLSYGIALECSSNAVQAIHHDLTLLIARAVKLEDVMKQPLWTRWIVIMLWLGSPKNPQYWESLREGMVNGAHWGGINLWGKVDMTVGESPLESPHFEEIMNILAKLTTYRHDPNPVDDPLWINSTNYDGKCGQMMRMLDAFEKMMRINSAPELHRSMVGLLCNEMRVAGIQWPRPIAHSQTRIRLSNDVGDQHPHLTHVRDPCLGVACAFAYGTQISVELKRTKSYFAQHTECLQALCPLLFRDFSVHDPPALWEFRASMWPLHYSTVSSRLYDPVNDPEHLACLELLFQYPTQCHCYRTGCQHVLLHLFHCAGTRDNRVDMRTGHFMNSSRPKKAFNLILAMLALSDTQDLSDLVFGWYRKPETAEHILRMCKAVKRSPTIFLGLLVDIVVEPRNKPMVRGEVSSLSLVVADLAIILESVKHALALPEDETNIPVLRRLASALQALPDNIRAEQCTPEERDIVELDLESVCNILNENADGYLHHRGLTCARSCRGNRAARNWLAIYVD